ncbi:MAG: hypothetical protein EBR82_00250 [Caulobacteraceae bacterium]|nr:hypothetical protein [Caulobacteraceae bacterium]
MIFTNMNDQLTISREGLDFIAKWEGCILKPYKDVAGLWTIGVGHLIQQGENFPQGVEISKDQALDILAADVRKCETAIKSHITVELNQNQFDALCSFGFNCGVGVYSNSGVARAVNSSDFDSVPARLLEWSKARVNGAVVTVPGLYNRRQAEGQLFTTPVDGSNFVISDYPVAWDSATLTEAQQRLQQLGLYTIAVDGVWGPASIKAVKDFATQLGLTVNDPPRGVPPSLLQALRDQTT